jgi:hypothetical protein
MLAQLRTLMSSLLARGRAARMRRFVLGHVGKTQVEAATRSVILIGGTDESSRMSQALDLARQAVMQGCTVLFFDSLPGSDVAGQLYSFAKQSKRENSFYVRGAFDATEVKLSDVLRRGDILYWGPSASADSPQAFADDLGPALDELSAALMQRVGRPRKSHVVIVMVDVIEAFSGFPEQIRSLPSSLNSLDASLVCCEYDDVAASGGLAETIEFHVKVHVTPLSGQARRPGASRRENLREGQALIKASYMRADPVVPIEPVAVNSNLSARADEYSPAR